MAVVLSLDNGASAVFTQNQIEVGSSPHSDFVVPPIYGIQDRHAVVRRIADRWIIESRGSWLLQVGDAPPNKRHWIHSGDQIDLANRGPTIHFRIDSTIDLQMEAAAATKPQPAPTAITASSKTFNPRSAAHRHPPPSPQPQPQPQPVAAEEPPDQTDLLPQSEAVSQHRHVSRRLRRPRRSGVPAVMFEAIKIVAGSLVGISAAYYIMCRLLPESQLLHAIAAELPASLQPEVIRGQPSDASQ